MLNNNNYTYFEHGSLILASQSLYYCYQSDDKYI